MIPNPSENKYRLSAFRAIIAQILIGLVAHFTAIKITGKLLKSYSFAALLSIENVFFCEDKVKGLSKSFIQSYMLFPSLNSMISSPYFSHISDMAEQQLLNSHLLGVNLGEKKNNEISR